MLLRHSITLILFSAFLVVQGCHLYESGGWFGRYLYLDCDYGLFYCGRAGSNRILSPTGAFPATIPLTKTCRQIAGRAPDVTDQLHTFLPFAVFAAAAYCPPQYIESRRCSPICKHRGDFIPTFVDGNGAGDPTYFVGYSPQDRAVVVSHQGTDPSSLESLLHNAYFRRKSLNHKFFPAAPENATVHSGYSDLHSATAENIRSEVEYRLDRHQAKTVYITGHSRGAAVAMLDALHLSLTLPSDVQIQAVVFGIPRVGNAAFVDYFDSKVLNYTSIIYGKDFVTKLMTSYVGYKHAKGEVHILHNGTAVRCPGHEFTGDARCYFGEDIIYWLPTKRGSVSDHYGPYPGDIYMKANIYGESLQCPTAPSL